MTVSKTLRYQVFRRDGFTCQYCGGKPPDVALTVDHVIPSALGGGDEPSNLTTACRDCNTGKSATPPDAEQVAAVDQRNKDLAVKMAQLAAEAETDRAALQWFVDKWDFYRYGDPPGKPVPIPGNWMSSVEVWLANGLTRSDIEYAIETAMGNDSVDPELVFRYMAGICWRILRERQDRASQRIWDQEQ